MIRLDGVDLTSYLSNVVKRTIVRSTQKSFWSTTERAQSDPTIEVLEINLNGERLINHISFELARFPQVVSVEWYDPAVRAWEPLRSGDRPVEKIPRWQRKLSTRPHLTPSEQGEPLRHQIADSAPAMVGTADGSASSNTLLAQHPQHYGTDHWVPVVWRTVPVSTTRIRLLLVRGAGIPPAKATGGAAQYSLGVKGLQIGYRVNSKSDVPSEAKITGASFGSSTDLLGSRVTFSLREQAASGVLRPDEGVAWRSEPQPVNYAVVNFYVDTRTGPQDPTNAMPLPGGEDETGMLPSGLGQVIDRFYIDPLTVGAHVNLYYSNDEPTGEFTALDEPLSYPIATEHGTLATGVLDPSTTVADTIEYSAEASCFTDIDNTYLQFNPRKAWFLGMDLLARTGNDGMAGGVEDHPWFSFGGNTLRQIGSTIEFVTATGKVASVDIDEDHLINSDFRVAVVFAPDAPAADEVNPYPKGLTLTYQFADREPVSVTRAVNADDLTTISAKPPRVVSIGRYNDFAVPGIPALAMRALTLKIEKPVTTDDVADFFEYPQGFARNPASATVNLGLTDNALLRAHASFVVAAVNPAGLVGGPGDRYAEMTWTPIFRDYVLRKGFLHVPPTRAKYWKFEFTQLVAEHYESFVPIHRAVKLFTARTVESHKALTAGTNWSVRNKGTPGIQTAVDLTDVNRYADAVGLLREAAVDTSRSHTATEGLYVANPSTAAEIAKLGWIWSYQPWHIGTDAPRFVHTQRHVYETVSVAHSTKMGFFAGLKELQAYRLDYLVDDDNEQYDEHFHDRLNIASDEFVRWDENRIATFSSGAGVTSKTFNSKRPVRGVQFASIQSDAYPLLADEGFYNPDLLAHWKPYGDASVERLLDRTVRVNRGWHARTYGEMEAAPAFDTYAEMDGHKYAELEGNQPNGLAGGGLSTEAVTPSRSGRVYAAARVAAAEGLHGPVSLEIVSSEGDVVLASAERTVTSGQEEVFHIGYQVGSAISGLTYGDMEEGIQTRTDVYEASGGTMSFNFGLRVAAPWDDLELATEDGTPLVAPTDYSNVRYVDGTSTVLLVDTTTTIPTGTVIVASMSLDRTYGSLDGTTYGSHETQAIEGDVYARLIQPGRFNDTFLIKKLSVFDAALTWEFSNDNGTSWWDGTDIRNNPEGVLMFPTDGTALRWRLRSFHPDVSVSALSFRPWYGGLLGAVPGRASNHVLGPNRSVVDDYPDIHDDPMWQQSDSPIPSYWYQPAAPEALPLPPAPPPEPEEGYRLVADTLLESSRVALYTEDGGVTYLTDPEAETHVPYGTASTVVLSDGTYFVASAMDSNAALGGGQTFIRLWHLDANLNVMGTPTDYYPENPVDAGALPAPWSLATDGNKVLMVFEDGYGQVPPPPDPLPWTDPVLLGDQNGGYRETAGTHLAAAPYAEEVTYEWVGTNPFLTTSDDSGFGSVTTTTGTNSNRGVGIWLDPYTTPAGKVVTSMSVTCRYRLDQLAGTPVPSPQTLMVNVQQDPASPEGWSQDAGYRFVPPSLSAWHEVTITGGPSGSDSPATPFIYWTDVSSGAGSLADLVAHMDTDGNGKGMQVGMTLGNAYAGTWKLTVSKVEVRVTLADV